MAQRVIPSLAILKVNFDEGADYIDLFVPFVAECLRAAPVPEVSLPDLQAHVSESFGLKIPQGALNTILTRAVRRGYAKRDKKILRRNDSALANLDLPKRRADALRQYEGLIDKIIAFCKTRYRVEWSPEQADSALLSYLVEGASGVLAAALGAGAVPAPAEDAPHAEFLMSAFVAHTCERDHEGFGFLETAVKGSMLSEVLFFPDIGAVGRRFDDVEVYFDTSFVLQALGHEGESRQAARVELLNLLYEENARLAIFDHTFDEIQGVLRAAAQALRNPRGVQRYFDTFQHFFDLGYTASDVELIIAKLERSIGGLRIRVKSPPPYTEELGIDELKLGSLLQEWVGYHSRDAKQRDVASVTAVHRLRKGEIYRNVEQCSAIFITTNTVVARATRRFFRDEYKEYRDEVVLHCMMDHLLTTLVWLKKPMRAPDLPRKRIIADCYAAMNPPDHLWKRYAQEIERLEKAGDISPDDYYLLRYSSEARNALMDTTLGGHQPFTEGTVAEVLEKARRAARADAEAALDEQKKARYEEKREAQAILKKTSEESAEAVLAERKARDEAENRVHIGRQAQLDRIRYRSTRIGRWAAVGAAPLPVILLGVATFLGLFLQDIPGGWWMPPIVMILALSGVAVFANIVFGTTLVSVLRQLEIVVSGAVERSLRRLVGLQ